MSVICACALAGAAAAEARVGKRARAGHGTGHSRSRSSHRAAKSRGRHGHARKHRRGGSRTRPLRNPGTPGGTAPEPAAAGRSRTSSGAAAIAAVLATPCEDTDLMPEPGNLGAVRAAVLCLVNRERAEHGEQPLSVNRKLQRAAEEHDLELVADDYFAHVSPSGETPAERIGATGYISSPSVGYVIGENLAWGTLGLATPQAIVEAWIASPGHLANILEDRYRDTGIAVVPAAPPSLGGGQPGATYAQEFGVILG